MTTSLADNSNEETEEMRLRTELLQAIGKKYYEERAFAPSLHFEIAVRWKDVIEQGLPADDKLEIIKKYQIPENYIFINPPKMNQEIKTVVSQAVINRDARIVLKQQKIAAGLSAIAKAITDILKKCEKNEVQVLEYLSDVIKIFADLQ